MTKRLLLIGVALATLMILLLVGAIGVGASLPDAQPATELTGSAPSVLSVPAPPPHCIDFDDLASATYNVGDIFVSRGVTVAVKDFQWSSGISTNTGHATIAAAAFAGGAGMEAGLNNVNLEFMLPGPTERLAFLFGEYGGNLNIEVNGVFQNFENFADINMANIGGVQVLVFGGLGLDIGAVILDGPVNQFKVGGQELWIDNVCAGPLADVGDAPDSSNHTAGSNMTAYPTAAVLARYPTVYDPSLGLPFGPIHWLPKQDAWLGHLVSQELDADRLPDQDPGTNLDPPADLADQDGGDDGLLPVPLLHCQRTTIQARVTVVGPARQRFINAWFDWNRDGDWQDDPLCSDQQAAPEWAVQNYKFTQGPGVYTLTLPAFLPFNPDPSQELWARLSLSEHEVLEDQSGQRPDGRGPEHGYLFGETEDYLLRDIPPQPDITIDKTATPTITHPGGPLGYTIVIANNGDAPAGGLVLEDQTPDGLDVNPDSVVASAGSVDFDPTNGVLHWIGDVAPHGDVIIEYQGVVRPLDDMCGRVLENVAVLQVVPGAVLHTRPARAKIICPDLGDAPDSTNHAGLRMTAYPMITATFPTVFDPGTGLPPGPAHRFPRSDAWLGQWVSMERDADLMPDEDGQTNIDPPNNAPDRDRFDDGVLRRPVLDHCKMTQAVVLVHYAPTATPREHYINAWFDWNRNGNWEDNFDCPTGAAPEWAVQDFPVPFAPDSSGNQVVTLPAFLPFNRTPERAMWARITLSEQKAPLNPDINRADGRGPDNGYRFGETEDYLIEGEPGGQPDVSIHKKVDKSHVVLGGRLAYTITLHNAGTGPANAVVVEDPIPAGTVYVTNTLHASKPITGFAGGVIKWQGDVLPNETVTITFKVDVLLTSANARCEGRIVNHAGLILPEGVAYPSNEVFSRLICPDLGDAPDSTNHPNKAMIAYPSGVQAEYPTVFDPATGLPQGPRHLLPQADAWLGPRQLPPSGERDADLLPDQDGVTNIDPPAGLDNQDKRDNGVLLSTLNLPHCQQTTFQYMVTIVGPQRERFVNVWFDWNRDGDWEDVLSCGDNLPAPEWAVRNQVIGLGPGTYVITATRFLPWNQVPDGPRWMRITLAEHPIDPTAAAPSDGSGPVNGYRYGETEDYYLMQEDPNDPGDVWVTKELVDARPSDEQAAVGDPPTRFFYRIHYGNSGPGPVANVQIVDTLPVSTSYHSSFSVPDIEPATVATPTVTWNAGTLYAGDNGWIDLWVKGLRALPPGTVITNTVQITTTSPDGDPNNNSYAVTATIPLLPPRITWPIPGTVCTGTLTVTGKSQIGTVVDLYVNGVFTATAAVDAGGNWAVPLSLPDGVHAIHAVARVIVSGATSSASPAVIVVVDSSLLWDPMSMTFTTIRDGHTWVQHIRTSDGRADPNGWSVVLRPFAPNTTYTVSVKICCASPTSVTLTISDTDYSLADTGGGIYQANFPAPTLPNVPITLTVDCGGEIETGGGVVLIDPDGYIFDVDVGVDKSDPISNLAGMTSTCLEYDTEKAAWDRWPAELYESQINPQVSGADGYFSYFTPAGDYQILVDPTASYQGYRTWTLEVVDEPVHIDIPLTPVYDKAHYQVTVDSSGFVPAELQVVQGSVVEWSNVEVDDEAWHSSTSDVDARSDTSGWDSGLLNRGESYGRQMDTLGVFTYADVEDDSLTGSITVCYAADIDCDQDVDVDDILAVAADWNKVSGAGDGYDARQDLNGDGVIDIVDVMLAVSQWSWTAP